MINQERHFNTAGPVNMKEHYKLNPLERWDLNEIMDLIDSKKYFLLHAPRQSGKTSCMLALRDKINSEDNFFCVYVNIESARGAKNNIDEVSSVIIGEIGSRIDNIFGEDEFLDLADEMDMKVKGSARINRYLKKISKLIKKPIVLLIDEIDSLHGDAIISLLSQLRAGYDDRGEFTPWSIMLTGVLDIKDYRLLNIDPKHITGGSCFNVKSESLTIGNFSRNDIEKLYLEHTKETGQIFDNEVFDLVFKYTDGQPWLVNALAFQACFKMQENRDRKIVITKRIMCEAKKQLILSKQTHLDQLADKLQQERIRNIIQPIIKGVNLNLNQQDVIYCRDLGLIKKSDQGSYVIANKIYQEVIPRELTESLQHRFLVEYPKPIWVDDDHSINIEKLMNLFVQYWRENSDTWKDSLSGYTEVAPHLIFQGFLQRIGNGHGEIDREYALGTKRVDLYLKWESPAGEQRIIFELKMHTENNNLESVKKDGLIQTAEYADKCNATESHLLIFDRRANIDWKDKVFTEIKEENKYKIKIWGM